MANCQNITFKKKRLCIGSLKRKVGIYDRNVVGKSIAGSAAHEEVYTLFKSVFADIETKNQQAFQTLDGVSLNPELTVSHVFITRFIAGVSAEQFIQFKGLNYKILKAENIDEADKWLRLRTNLRGDVNKAGAQ